MDIPREAQIGYEVGGRIHDDDYEIIYDIYIGETQFALAKKDSSGRPILSWLFDALRVDANFDLDYLISVLKEIRDGLEDDDIT